MADSINIELHGYIYFLLVVALFAFENLIANNFLFLLVVYAGLGFIYLVGVPLLLYYWMNNRWHFMGKIERLSIYGLVFLFFPGLILFAPFLNLRINGENEV